MSAPRPHARLTGVQLTLLVLLLIVQFALRTHNPLEQPAFVDEDYHVRRGELVYQFDRNPIEFSNGKLLFYYWLGLFVPQGDSALAVGRLAVAIFSLITTAGVAAVANSLFGRRAILPAMALYALAPFAFFFERMALADPFAGGLATLTIWQSIRLARSCRPTFRFGALVGLLLGMTTLAKLTMLPVLALPFAAGLLWMSPMLRSALKNNSRTSPPDPLSTSREGESGREQVPSPRVERGFRGEVNLFGRISPRSGRRRAAFRAWIRAVWQRYRRAWAGLVAVAGFLWAWFLLGMIAYRLAGEQPKFFTRYLVHGGPEDLSLFDNARATVHGAGDFLSMVAVIALPLLAVLLLWRRTTAASYVLLWLAALWVPIIVLGNPVRTRYLMAGVPALAVLFGGGVATLIEMAPRRVPANTAIAATVGVWAALFALPFGWNAATDPDNLSLPKKDTYDYISGPFAGWGTRDALQFLIKNGERLPVLVEGQAEPRMLIPAVGVLQHCGSISLHVTGDFMWSCIDARTFPIGAIPADVREWGPLMEGIETWPFVYLVTEFSGTVPDDLAQQWALVYASPRPLGGWTVAVWRVTATDS